MNRLKTKVQNRARRSDRVRSKTIGSTKRPRLSVFISNRNVTAQIINDEKGETLAYATSANATRSKGTLSDKAANVGKDIAKAAKGKKIKKVVFDRGPKLYHGRIKALADAAREEGLEF